MTERADPGGAAADAAIAWLGVRKEYGKQVALRGVDLSVPRGQALVLLGPNGAGKTTLLRIGAALTRATEGEVRFAGHELRAEDRAGVGYLGHATLLYGNLSPLENLLFYGRIFGVSDARSKAEEILALAGLGRRMREPVSRLSRGTQQRAALCRAFFHEPDVLLLDEPFTGLDPRGIELLGEWVRRRVGAGGSAVLTTHDLAAGLEAADRVAVLAGGRTVAERDAVSLSLSELQRFYDSATEAARA